MFNAKLITMMVLLIALITGSALAGDANYKMYGVLNTSFDYFTSYDALGGSDTDMWLSSNTSRFGIRGHRELEPGMTFIWQFENSIDVVSKGGTLAARNSYVGVKRDKFGTLILGIHDSPMKMLGRKVEMFNEHLADHRIGTMGYDTRYNEVALWKSPNWNNFSFAGSWQMPQAGLGGEEDMNFSFNGIYAKDAFLLGGGYEMRGANGGLVAGIETEAAFRFAGKYTADEFALGGFFQGISNKGGVEDVSAQTINVTGKYIFNEKYTFKGTFTMFDPNTDVDEDAGMTFGIGLDRTWSKGLKNYVEFAMTSNEETAVYGLGIGNGHGVGLFPLVGGESPWAISTGWKVYF